MINTYLSNTTLIAAAEGMFSRGTAIAVSGLLIVFMALTLISLFIAALPKILKLVGHLLPEVKESHSGELHPESQVADDLAVLAGIGFVLHTELQRQLTAEKSSVVKS